MTDPKQRTLTFPWTLGSNTVAEDEFAQPTGDRPVLRQARNMRLRSTGAFPVKMPGYSTLRTGTVGGLCGGFAPVGDQESTVQFLLPNEGNRRIAAGAITQLPSAISGATLQNLGYPAQVTQSFALPGSLGTTAPAVAVHGTLTYVASLRPYSSVAAGVYVAVQDSTGAIRVPATLVVPSDSTFVGLTVHATAGVRLWVMVSGVLYISALSLTGLTLSVGGLVAVYTPGSATAGTVKVCSDGTDFAWISCITTGGTATAILIRRDILAATNTTAVLAPATTASSYTAVSAISVASTSYVAVAVQVAGGQYQAVYDGSALTLTHGNTAGTLAAYSDPFTCFGIDSTGSYAIFGASGPTTGSFASASTVDATTHWRALASGTLIATTVLPWTRVLGAASYKRSDTECYPILATQHCRNLVSSNDPSSLDFLLDPSIEIFWGWGTRLQCIGRIGADAALRYSSATAQRNSCPVFASGETVVIGYVEDQTRGLVANGTGYQTRVTTLDFSTYQARNAPTAQGPTLVSGAYPLSWDGSELTEVCAPHAPTIRVAVSGGSGTALTGTYIFRAVAQWRDASGQIHRSAASASVSVSPAAQSPIVTVTKPILYRDDVYQESFEIVVYATLAGGTSFFAQRLTPTAKTTHVWTFGNVSTPTSGPLNPLLYSTGGAQQPLAAYCPPAFSDAALIGSRLWGVDAEKPWRVWPSKIKEEGVAFEFNPDLVVSFPASAGAILAVCEARGYPIFLCERGVWAVAGEGKNNSLVGQDFSAPLQISAIPCTSRQSVVRTPVGVMFLSGDRFAVANESGAQVLDVIDASAT